uniref:UDENN domain-containing protein n=1 Tax=Ursus americanus TaxID=9643 RepID=A0A452SCL3_URSAM
MQMVPKFCFPFDVEREPPSPAVQHFTFALTDLSGTRRFGFCHLRAGAHSCLCILSHLPWFEVFYKLLNTVGDLLAQNQVSEVEELLLNLLQQPLPRTQASIELGSGVTVSSAQSIPPPAPGNSWPLSCFVAPDSGRLPSIPENVSGRESWGRGEVPKPRRGGRILRSLAPSASLRSSEEPNGARGGGDRREHRGAVRRSPGGEKGPTHRQQAQHREAGPAGPGMGPRPGFAPGGGTVGRIPGSNSTGRDLRQSPGSAPWTSG